MVAGSLATLLDEGRYTECRQAAERLLREPDLADIERAQACLALSHSLMGLHDSQEAMAPGELAVYFGRRAGAYDLVGRALCHLAALYHENRLQKRAVACLE
ncbi:MAG TPA: hypothetical protein VD902_11490, partial [Symbiobacteriaceae bacterium]|nr:hypothetical protein [Symbiobacteriaceae bacterium]